MNRSVNRSVTDDGQNPDAPSSVRSFELAAGDVISHQSRRRAQWITRTAGVVVLAKPYLPRLK